MKERISKLILLLILPLVPFTGISNALLYDTESSMNNSFSAASLDITLLDAGGDEISGLLFDKNKLKGDEELIQKIKVSNSGTLDFYYHPEFELKNGNLNVCEGISLKASKEGSEVYEGSLKDFNLATMSAQITNSTDEWEFALTHENSDESLQGEICEFNIAFLAYQNIDNTGFSDKEKVASKVGFAYEPVLTAYHNSSSYKFIFTLSNLSNFTGFDYSLIYDTDTITDFASGSASLSGETSKVTEIDLGTESGGVFTPQINPHNFNLNINLIDIDGDALTLSKQL